MVLLEERRETWSFRSLLVLSVCLLVHPSLADPDSLTESKVKAAFLYNFTKFVKWPANTLGPHDSLTICTLGDRPLEGVIDETIAGKTVDGHPLATRRVSNETGLKGCQVLFVSGEELRHAEGLLAGHGVSGILTISEVADSKDRLRNLAIITFVPDTNRIRFVISTKAAEKSGVGVSSKLLSLAIEVDQ